MWYYVYTPIEKLTHLPIYLVSIGLHELQPHISREHGFDYDQFLYSSTGEGTLVMNGRRTLLKPGSAVYIPARTAHEYYPHGDRWDIRWVSCGGEALPALCRALAMQGGAYHAQDIAPLDILLGRMHDELVRSKVQGAYIASGMVSEFVAEFARQTGLLPLDSEEGAATSEGYEQYMLRLRDYVAYHYMHPIRIEEMCTLISVTPQHICRIFKHCTGMRPMEYVAQVRINAAKDLLRTTSHSVKDIAVWCGMENCNYFCRVFRRIENMTPGEYRRRVQQ